MLWIWKLLVFFCLIDVSILFAIVWSGNLKDDDIMSSSTKDGC